MRWSGAMNTIAKYITPVVVQRVQIANDLRNEKETKDKPVSNSKSAVVTVGPLPLKLLQLDCIQWVLESSHKPSQRNVTRMVQQIIALLFASAHQLPMVSRLKRTCQSQSGM